MYFSSSWCQSSWLYLQQPFSKCSLGLGLCRVPVQGRGTAEGCPLLGRHLSHLKVEALANLIADQECCQLFYKSTFIAHVYSPINCFSKISAWSSARTYIGCARIAGVIFAMFFKLITIIAANSRLLMVSSCIEETFASSQAAHLLGSPTAHVSPISLSTP